MQIIFSPDKKIKGRETGQLVEYVINEIPEITPGARIPNVLADLEYDEVESSNTLTHLEIVPQNLSVDGPHLALSISNPNVAAVNNTTKTIYQMDDGVVDIYISAYGYSEQKLNHTFAAIQDSHNETTGYVSGSLSNHIHTAVHNLISGLQQSNSIQQYITSSNGDIDAPEITLNENIFTGALDFSGISVMRTGRTNDGFPATLVTNRHALVAKHVAGSVGTEYLFMRSDGTFQKVSVQARTDTTGNDLTVLYFDQALTGITPYKVLPTDWEDTYAPSCNYSTETTSILPTLRKSRHFGDGSTGSCIVINTLRYYSNTSTLVYNTRAPIIAPNEIPEIWGTQAIGGDSGGPSFLLINNELILIGSQYTVTQATAISKHVSEINTIMDTQAGAAPGTYTLTHPDLSGFTTF